MSSNDNGATKPTRRPSIEPSGVSLQGHRGMRQRLDARLSQIRNRHAGQISCAPGCSMCCHGMFDISRADAALMAEGLRILDSEVRAEVRKRASVLHQRLLTAFPELQPPYFLDRIDEADLDRFIDEVGGVRCPLLDEKDACLVYEYRPVQCRLEGIPMVDAHDGLFGDWCELNFREGITETMLEDLKLDYYEIQQIEGDATIFIASVCL